MLKLIIILLLIFQLIISEDDYYKILGVSHTASDMEIKKAFKKLSLLYHPDKLKNPSQTQKSKYTDIVNAYETLKDKQLRSKYDKSLRNKKFNQDYGRNKKKYDYETNNNYGFDDFDDIYERFYQNYGQNFGNNNNNKNKKKNNQFKDTKVQELTKNTFNTIYPSNFAWVILLYNDSIKPDLVKTYILFAKKFVEIFKVAAIDCQEQSSLCSKLGYSKWDSKIKIVGFSSKQSDKSKNLYQSFDFKEITIENMQIFATDLVENIVISVDFNGYLQFLLTTLNKKKVLLFTEKESPPVLFKSIANTYDEYMTFGIVQSSDKKLCSAFNVEKFPTIMVLTHPADYDGEIYSQANNIQDIQKYLNSHLGQYKFLDSIKPQQGKINLLTNIKLNLGICSEYENNFCVLLVGSDNNKVFQMQHKYLGDVASKFSYTSKFQFFHSRISFVNYKLFPKITDSEDVILVAIKNKKKKYSIYTNELNSRKIIEWLDDLLGGNGKFHEMNGNLLDNVKDYPEYINSLKDSQKNQSNDNNLQNDSSVKDAMNDLLEKIKQYYNEL